MKNKKKRGTFLIVVGVILILAALALTFYNQWDGRRADQAAQLTVSELEDVMQDIDEEAVPDLNDKDQPMPVIEMDGYRYIGVLEIPELNLSLPVMEEWDYTRLKIAPCRFSGSYFADDLVIAGHNYGKHFSPIKWIDPGTDVYFTNVENVVFHYTVDHVETLKPTQVEDMVTGDWDLTLFTCTTGGQSRCTVRCYRVQE